MQDTPAEETDSYQLTEAQQNEVILRCIGFVDCLRETAANIIVDFVKKPPCPTAKVLLLNNPEILAIRALNQACKDLLLPKHRPAGVSLH